MVSMAALGYPLGGYTWTWIACRSLNASREVVQQQELQNDLITNKATTAISTTTKIGFLFRLGKKRFF